MSEKFASLQCSEFGPDNGEIISDPDSSDNGEDDDSESKAKSEQLCDEVDPSSVLVKVKPTISKPRLDSAEGDESEDENETCDSEEDSDDDGAAWITPSNLSRAKKQMNADIEEEKSVKVACITTDFAMQVCVSLFLL